MTVHATLAPSAAHRWFECPGSIRMSAGIERKPSFYADEGTAAHELAASCLMDQTEAATHIGRVIRVGPGAGRASFTVDETMAEAVQEFLDLVNVLSQTGYELTYEVKLDLGHLWEGTWGTGDAVLYHRKNKHLVVIDFKYGAGVPVDPEENPQLLSYASGAYRLHHNSGVEGITLIVVQPRAAGLSIKKWDTTPERLEEFELEFQHSAEATQREDAPLIPGEWCQFCPAAGVCPALRQKSLEIAQAEFTNGSGGVEIELPDPNLLTPTQLGRVLEEVAIVEAWCEEVRKAALQAALGGMLPPGFKLVAKKTQRRWVDELKAARALIQLYELEDEVVWVRKVITPAKAEKLLGKKDAKGLKALIMNPMGAPTLAPLDDKRTALSVDAAREFDIGDAA